MKSNYQVIRYEPKLKQQVIDLQSHLWSPNAALNTAYFEWKYERSPYVDPPLIYLAMQDGDVVGMRGFFGGPWEGGMPKQPLNVLYADDLVIAPEHRNRSLVSNIMAAAFADLTRQNFQYVLNLSAGSVTFLSSLAMGWRNVGSMQPMRRRSLRLALRRRRDRLMARIPILSRMLGRTPGPVPGNGEQCLANLDPKQVRRSTRNRWIFLENAPRSTDMAQLVERIGGDGRIRQARDSKYLDWRFQNPLSRYRFLYWDNGRLEGYLVLQEYTSAYAKKEVVNIVDWQGSSAAVQRGLLRAAIKLARGRRLIIWSASLPQQMLALLEDARFRLERGPQSAAEQRYVLLLRATSDAELGGNYRFAGLPLLDLKSWDLRLLDSMLG